MSILRNLLIVALAGPAMLVGAPSALSYEWDIAKPGRYPGGLPCAKTTGSWVCFQSKGEKFWVKDIAGDEMSAIAKWRLPQQGTREGYCRNRLGVGHWGYCNKSFLEGRLVHWWAARYDRDTNRFYGPWSAGKEAHA